MTYTEAVEAIEAEATAKLRYGAPSRENPRQILARPFAKVTTDRVLEADSVLYVDPVGGCEARIMATARGIQSCGFLRTFIEESLVCVVDDPSLQEYLGGIVLMAAFSARIDGLVSNGPVWLTLGMHVLKGETVVAMHKGRPVVGPSLIIGTRPCDGLHFPAQAAKYFPNAPGSPLIWSPLQQHAAEFKELCGYEPYELVGSDA